MIHMNFGAESKITHDEQKQNLGILQQKCRFFCKTTINVDFYETQNRFSTLLSEHRYILDLKQNLYRQKEEYNELFGLNMISI